MHSFSSSTGEGDGVFKEKKIGEILVALGKVNEDQIDEALAIQKTDPRNIGKILISLGYISEDDLAQALSMRLNVEYVALFEVQVDPEVLGIIDEDVLLQHKAVPLRVEDGRLIVAMSDPNDIYARSDLTISAGYPITAVVAAEDAVRRLQDHLFGNGAVVDGALAELADAVQAYRATEEPNAEAARKARRAEPGAQPEADLGEPVFEPNGAREEAPARGGGRRSSRGAKKVGEILISQGQLTQGQLDQALELQKSDGRDLGKILVGLGFVTPVDLGRALAERLKLDFVVVADLSENEVDPAALELINEEALRKYMALPLRVEDGRLLVAMSDPNDIFALEDLRIIAKHPITPLVATEEDIKGAFAALFGDEGLYPEVDGEHDDGGDVGQGTLPPVENPGRDDAPEEPRNGAAKGFVVGVNGTAAPTGGGPAGGGRGELERIEKSRNKKVAVGGGRIGDILLSMGKVTEEQLDQALIMQKDDPREVGKILLSLGHIEKGDLAEALARRLRLEFVQLTERDVDRAAASLVEQKVLRRHGVVPLRIEGGRLVVAMSDPTNIYALEDLMMISGHPITPVVALEEEIQRVHNKVFAMSEEISEFLEEASKETFEQDHGDLDLGVETSPDEAPIIRLVSSILQQAVGDGASDIHIEPQARELAVRMRVDGVLRESMTVPPKLQNGVTARLKILANLDIAEKRIPQDGRFSVKLGGTKIDLRVASLPTVYGEKIVLRLLDTSNATVELTKLGFPPKVYERYEEVFHRPYGAILVTGPTGSGKSTSLYATLNELNTPEKNIITVEDPVEYRMRGVNQVQTNPKAGLTFASALKSILRADPDIVMIGEIRDFETAKIAVEAALTGHLVLATLHTNDAPGAVSRLNDMGVEPFLTSSAVDCVIAQRLARRLCENCKEPVELEREILEGIRFPFDYVPEAAFLDFHKAVGCDRCGDSGYRGRVGLYELLVVSDNIKDMILRGESTLEIGRVGEEEGMIRLRDDGLLKAAAGVTTIEEILRTVV